MSIERIVMAFAGFMIMLTIALGVAESPIFHHHYWLYFTAFIGFNLFQSAFTGFCPLALILKKMGKQPGAAF
ncbi:YgaP family membrane protein [Thiosocius teredinicola]|uniref:YgaP family membrane protein n=1 Tax=Thiosocius teredinicola TaxID=1973002 RepID=UPI000990B59A